MALIRHTPIKPVLPLVWEDLAGASALVQALIALLIRLFASLLQSAMFVSPQFAAPLPLIPERFATSQKTVRLSRTMEVMTRRVSNGSCVSGVCNGEES